ncbi:MAG: hypothetical protein C0490_11045, partial [Marivirga sp.]|nr:hypothetical protein [Marivirga sp.]
MGATTTFSLGGLLQTVNGNLTFISTGATPREVRLKNGGTGYNLNVGGNFIIQGGAITLSQNQTSSTSITVAGNFTMSGGTLTLGTLNDAALDVFLNGNYQKTGGTINRGTGTGPGSIHFDGATQTFSDNTDITSAINFIVESGSILNLGTSSLTGSGTLNLNAGGTIHVGSVHPAGAIQTGTAAGNIRLSGIRTYQAGSTIVYDGVGQQFTALGHPAAANTIINNTNNVRMLSDATINGDLTVSNGNLLVESATLTLGGLYNQVGGFIGITPNSSIIINGSGTFGNLILLPYSFPGNPMNNLTINRAGGGPNIVSQGTANLSVAGTFTLQEGDLFLGSNNSLTVLGDFVRVNGTLSSDVFGNFAVAGSGSLPADIILTGAINNLSMDRTSPDPGGNVFNTTSTLVVNNLNLTSGSFSHSGGVSMADGGTITRRWGVLNNAVGAVGQYNVVYGANNAPNTNSGLELPASAGILDNLTLNNTFNVTDPFVGAPFTMTLTSPVLAEGNVTVTEGTLITNDFDINVGGNFTIATNGAFQPGNSKITFDGGAAQVLSSVATLNLVDVEVNQSPAATVSFSVGTTVAIQNSLLVNSASSVSVGTNQLTLLSSASGTAFVGPLPTGASITGSVIAQRHLPNLAGIRAYRYLATPTVGSFVSDWQAEFPITGTFSNPSIGSGIISTNPSMFRYDETLVIGSAELGAGYRAYPASGSSTVAPLNNGEGYAAFVRTTGAIVFDTRGSLRQGDVSRAVTNSGGVNGGWHLLGNPYAAPIDWDAIAPDLVGVDDAIYFTDNTNNGLGGGNVSYVAGVARSEE